MYIPTKSAIWVESNEPIVKSKLSAVVFSQVALLQNRTDFLHDNIIPNSSWIIPV